MENLETKRVAIRAPEYFPRVSYLALMASVDVFIVADTFQYSRQSFHNRMEIGVPEGRRWLSVPLTGSKFGRRILDVEIDGSDRKWPSQHRRSLEMNYRSSPFYEFYGPEWSPLLERPFGTLGNLTVSSVLWLHKHFGLRCELVFASELTGSPDSLGDVCSELQISELVALPETAAFDRGHGVNVRPLSISLPRYRQVFPGYQADLSAIDLLFNYGPESYAYLGVHSNRLK